MSKKFRFTVEVDLNGDIQKNKFRNVLSTMLTPLFRTFSIIETVAAPEAGSEVAFIYDSSGHSPCHAVVKDIDGPWSKNRFGFCGVEPAIGPVHAIPTPQGGLCTACEKYIEKGKDDVWRVRKDPPLPGIHVRKQADCSYYDED